MADSAQAPVQEHWSETNGKKYRRGSRLPKKTDTRPPVPAAETPKVPWTWEEDGMTAVSYTHLDVYKRQHPPSAAPRTLPDIVPRTNAHPIDGI